MRANDWLNAHANDKVHSQFGEDGIAARLLEVLPRRDSWCVEFGAWDGRHLSTTLLLRERGYRAVLIEGDAQRHRELQEWIAASEPGSIALQGYVAPSGPSSLDALLAQTPIPIDFDFLSIDIDGADYQVWEGVERYRPKAVCIECNPSFPDDAVFVQEHDNQGSSMLAMVELGRRKGYELVATLGGNVFLVDREYFPLFEIHDNSLTALREWRGSICSFAQTYRGELIPYGARGLIWAEDPLVSAEIHRLPEICARVQTLDAEGREAWRKLVALRDRLLGLEGG